MEDAAAQNDSRAQTLLTLLDNPFRSLTPINVASGASLVGMTLALTWNAFETYNAVVPRVSEIVAVIVLVIVGKLVVDYFAIVRALPLSLALAKPLAALNRLAAPFLNLGSWVARTARGPRMRARATDRVSPDDIQIIMSEGEEPRKIELIDPDEREMIAGIIEMGERYASEIMIPRPDVVALEATATIDHALEVAIQYGHSRLPVYEEDIDHIVGTLHVKDLLPALRSSKTVALRELLRPAYYVPETARADNILRDLLRNRVHMAIVVDEYGGTSGVLTIEDVIEEIVGEIRDEYDVAEEVPFQRVGENEMLFDARVSLAEFISEFQAELPTQETDTLGGLVYNQLGRLPRVGDQITIGNVQLAVVSMTGRRLQKIRAIKLPPEPQPTTKTNEQETATK